MLRNRLRELGAATGGTKAQMWARLVEAETKAREATELRRRLEQRAADLRADTVPVEANVTNVPKMPEQPSAAERRARP